MNTGAPPPYTPSVNPNASAPPFIAPSAAAGYDVKTDNRGYTAVPAASGYVAAAPAQVAQPGPAVSGVPNSATIEKANAAVRYAQFVAKNELSNAVAGQLQDILSRCDVVLLCDDSSSMNNTIADENGDPFAANKPTRWLELKKLAAALIDTVTAVKPEGLDIYFLNRGKLQGVNTVAGLQATFLQPPNGSTPLLGALDRICRDKQDVCSADHPLLLVVITDGEPSDGSRNDLWQCLSRITSKGSVHVSFAECTDNEDDMQYLDEMDGQIRNFDNTDDYREELRRVKTAQGSQFKFTYIDYVIKILLATFVRWYFRLDQMAVGGNNNNVYAGGGGGGGGGGNAAVARLFQPPNQPFNNQPNNNQNSCCVLL